MTYDEALNKSGDCLINLDITKNDSYEGNFFDGMFLQVTVALSTNNIADIESDGATIANVGENKQLSYIILPGEGKNIEIKGEASDFAIESISINAIDMNLALSFDSTEIKDKVSDLNDAISKIDDGAGDLSNGASSLSSSITTLGTYLRNAKSGASSAVSASDSLAKGSNELVSKGQELKSASNTLLTTVCAQAESSINAKLAQVGMPSVSLNSSNYSQVIGTLIAQLQNVAAGNPDMAGSISGVVAELQATNAQLSSIDTFNKGVAEYVAGVENLDGGQQQLNAGLNDLSDSLENLCNAFDKLDGGAGDLSAGAKTLSDGTGELLENTDGMDEEIDSEIQAKIDELTDKDIKCGSFASSRNENINSVQFVMKLDVSNNDSQENATTDDEESTAKTFWEKLLALFGLE